MFMSRANKNFPDTLLRMVVSIATLVAACTCVVAQEDENKNAPRIGVISGRVVNEHGQPVSHAVVYLGAPMEPTQARVSATDDGGNFQIGGLDALLYTANASAPGYVAMPRDAEALPSYYRIGDSVTVSLIKGGVITGTVVSPTGEPLVQVGVRAILIRDANGKPPGVGRFLFEKQTDDRGVYRIYGLSPGTYIVAAGGRGAFAYQGNAYDTDVPTYAPSSTRDTAMEVTVRAGEETTLDIRYRGEAGHAVSGVISGPVMSFAGANVSLMQIVNGAVSPSAFSSQGFNRKGFALYGVADGDYELIAQSIPSPGQTIASEPRRITVKGADITGLEIVLKELASIRGRVVMEPSTAAECKQKRQPLLAETAVFARRSDQKTPRDQLIYPNFSLQAIPDKTGDFTLRNLTPGQFKLSTRFFAKYWFLRSMVRENGALPLRTAANPQSDLARNGISLKFGERISGVTVTLAAGAASLRGAVKPGEGESLPAKLYVHLVPAEKENAEDVLRYFATAVQADGTFAFNNLPPGRYWALARQATDNEPQPNATSATDEAEARAKIRRAAEAAKSEVEFKRCQNVIGYQVPLKISAPKN
jgi:hypothetical protein